MKSIVYLGLFILSCQPVTMENSQASDPYNYYDSEILGSWKNDQANLYITFNPFEEFIVTKYLRTAYSYGHTILDAGFYERVADTLILMLDSGRAYHYYLHSFDSQLLLEPLNSFSAYYFEGNWNTVPLIVDFEPKPLPGPGRPVNPLPVEPAPVVITGPSAPAADNHKKRPEKPVLIRLERPQKEQVKEKEIQEKAQKPYTR